VEIYLLGEGGGIGRIRRKGKKDRCFFLAPKGLQWNLSPSPEKTSVRVRGPFLFFLSGGKRPPSASIRRRGNRLFFGAKSGTRERAGSEKKRGGLI